MTTQEMHTLILSMCVLLPFGVKNPASLASFLYDRRYDMKSEYAERMTFSQIDTQTDHAARIEKIKRKLLFSLTCSLNKKHPSKYL